MKNFKKTIILSITILFIVIYFIYDYLNNDVMEVIEDDIFLEENQGITEKNIINLHITGEVNYPRDY